MSIKAVAWVVDNYDRVGGKPTCMQYKAMIALAEWSDGDYVSFPSVGKIAFRLDRDTRQAKRVMKELADRGDVYVIRPKTQGRGQFNRYLLHCNQLATDIAETLETHEQLAGLVESPMDAAKGLLLARQAGAIQGEKEAQSEEPKEVPAPVEPFPVEKEMQMLLSWGRGGQVPSFDAKTLAELELEVVNTNWRISEEHRNLLCLLRYVTHWPLPLPNKRSFWVKTFNDHIEQFGYDLGKVARLYATAYARLKQQQERAKEMGNTLTLPPQPSTLTNTMAAIAQEWEQEKRKKGKGVAIASVVSQLADGEKSMEDIIKERGLV